ncbi:protein-disulfide reductase DsbD [Solimicrobium silvestre]|uniref:Thiol:disulfide interchange protein DsbD n=1 Tax=Solimicrobium silvestre TaxID=2099400 RepID=A0A2S9H2A2_9BURK|nr:protein-disulfide reductase DsbD [Solimicrobium silvestre]PRC94115.1 Thiol:disulfide interchange protein [Solimicrobium silvestre]
MSPLPRTTSSKIFAVLNQLIVSLLFLCGLTNAIADTDFLEPEQAFQFSSKQIAPDRIEVTYLIADGYYMYRERYKFVAIGATLGEPIFPKGHVKFDETFQKNVETFTHSITVQIPILSVDTAQPKFTLISHGQGCSEQGLCYAPLESKQTFDTAKFKFESTAPPTAGGDDSNKLRNSLQSGRLIIIMPLFLLLGLGLAFTPCVLPMVPILSSIIVGEGASVGRQRGLILSLSYSFGMAIVYTALGVAAGLLGEGLAAALQNPWVLGAFGLLLVGLSLSMFNVYHLQVPAFLQSKLSQVSDQQRAGKLIGVFVMGAISALIIGPCVAAPLASALLYISQTRNVLIGGAALFSMAMGMSVPLILVGLSAGSLLPRAGRWMEAVKQLFGVLMLAMALWLVSPVLPVWLQMLGWATLLIGYGVFLLRHRAVLGKAVALALCVLGGMELIGAASGGRDVFAPLSHFYNQSGAHIQFARVKSLAELEHALQAAKVQGKPVMLDFYADWCVSCKEMEKFTFTDQRIQAKFATMVLLQVDVTANNEDVKALLKRFNLFGPPGMIFFDLDSNESGRVIGFEKAEKFVTSLANFVVVKATP